ncbi:MAG: hypothetical protein MUF54_17830, partial [Polyangiaceae bacterium]|nr:hypothetical protein [Polyangiaceae bacterium]
MVADLAATLSLADTSELRVRDAGEQTVTEVDTRPALELNLRSRRFGFTLIYSPWVLLRGQALDRPELLHTGVASASWHTRRLRLWVGQDVTWGRRLFLGLGEDDLPASGVGRDPIGPDPTLRAVPSVESVPYLAYSSTAAADWSWTRRLTVNGA